MDRDEALKRLQDEELDILLMLDEFCSSNSITWFMDSGTALGAARHKGFIPWDDDVDVAMLRQDYDCFIELAFTGLPKGYSLHTFSNTPGYSAFFAKIYKDGTRFETKETRNAGCTQGIFVDVFCYDRLASDPKLRKRQLSEATKWQRLSYLYHSGSIVVPHAGFVGSAEKFACRCAHVLVKAFVGHNRDALWRGYYRHAIIEDETLLSDDTINLSYAYGKTRPYGVLFPLSTCEFEGHMLPIPGDVDKYLTLLYGDWRTLPDPERRRTNMPLRITFSDGSLWEAR